jgi:hypothetical protein
MMKNKWTTWYGVLAIGFLVSISLAAPQQAGPQDPSFLSARHTRFGTIEFDPPVPIDWQRVASDHFRDFDPQQPDSAGLATVMSYSSEIDRLSSIPYSAPAPQLVAEGFYYLIGPNGIHRLTDIRLKGILRYRVPFGGAGALQGPTYHGVLEATIRGVPVPEVRGGFVVRLSEPWPEDTRAQAESRRAMGLRERPQLDTLSDRARFETVVLEFVFAITDPLSAFIFRQWANDLHCWRMCCEHRYQLQRADDATTTLATVEYECDI